MEIDDRWQSAYGDLEFDSAKFPDAPGMVRQLHAMGFKVTVWVMPFVEENSAAYRWPHFPETPAGGCPMCPQLMLSLCVLCNASVHSMPGASHKLYRSVVAARLLIASQCEQCYGACREGSAKGYFVTSTAPGLFMKPGFFRWCARLSNLKACFLVIIFGSCSILAT